MRFRARRGNVGQRVAIIEPQCQGLEHASFNAALVAATLATCADATVDLYAETTHLDEIRQLLVSTRGSSAERVCWHPIVTPPRRAVGWSRAASVRQLFVDVDRAFQARPPHSVVIATTDSFVLTLLKGKLFSAWSGLPTVAVFHEVLALLVRRRRSSRRWGFAASLALPHPRGLTYLVLAKSILIELEQVAPRVAARTLAIDLPSLLTDLPDHGGNRATPPLRFGFVGGGRGAKGFREFLEIASAIRQSQPQVVFEIVGSAPADIPRSAMAHLDWSDRKLPLVEFVQRLRALSHVIWLGDPQHYRLVASASLADVIAMGIPVICLSGPFVRHLFDRLGEIGVRCETLSDVQKEVMNIVTDFSHDAYQRQVRAGVAAAAVLAPEACAPLLGRALDCQAAEPPTDVMGRDN